MNKNIPYTPYMNKGSIVFRTITEKVSWEKLEKRIL